jgi:hypothetical protein
MRASLVSPRRRRIAGRAVEAGAFCLQLEAYLRVTVADVYIVIRMSYDQLERVWKTKTSQDPTLANAARMGHPEVQNQHIRATRPVPHGVGQPLIRTFEPSIGRKKRKVCA